MEADSLIKYELRKGMALYIYDSRSLSSMSLDSHDVRIARNDWLVDASTI